MDFGYRSPFIDLFRRGEVARDVRLLAAQGVLAPRAHEQLALLVLLSDDPDPEVAATANATLAALPPGALREFLAGSDVPAEMREFFAARGVHPAGTSAEGAAVPLVNGPAELPVAAGEDQEEAEPEKGADTTLISGLPILDKMKLAMKGTREQRAVLIRDPNKLVSSAVLSSPKLTDSEVESFTKMGNVSEEVLRVIGNNRSWLKNYGVMLGLVRNAKTPLAISMQLIQRLNERDQKMLAVDRNVPEALRLMARKLIAKALK
jgi:hypothetical protein